MKNSFVCITSMLKRWEKGVHVDESLVFHERYEVEYKNKKI